MTFKRRKIILIEQSQESQRIKFQEKVFILSCDSTITTLFIRHTRVRTNNNSTNY